MLRREVREGRLDGAAVEAVLAGTGRAAAAAAVARGPHRRARSRCCVCSPAGNTNKDIAQRLYLSPRTVGHHVQHIYRKLGVSTRAGATLFGMQHDLLGEDGGD